MTGTSSSTHRHGILTALVLALLVVAGHYAMSKHFGIYADDIFGVAPSITHGFDDALARMDKHLFGLKFQGRMFTNFMPQLFTALGMELGGLPGVYAVAATLFCSAALLLFWLVVRAFGPRMAFASAAVFVFFPADINKIYLMHAFVHWAALCICLFALHLHLSGHRVLAFAVATCCLFYYESAFLPFLAAPLLAWDDRPRLTRRFLAHTALCIAILAAVFALRSVGGDFRMGGEHSMAQGGVAGLLRMGLTSAMNMVLGPLTSLASYPYAMLRLARNITPGVVYAILGGTALAAVAFALSPRKDGTSYRSEHHFGGGDFAFSASLRSPHLDSNLVRAFLAGLIMLCASYLLSFTSFPAMHLWGRATREHFAAGFGMALVGGSILTFVLNYLTDKAGRIGAALACGAIIGLLMGYAFHVQEEYADNWRNKQWLWRQITDLAPDAGEGTRIFVLDKDLPAESRPIASIRSWEMPVYLKHLYAYPEQWSTPPRAFIVTQDWRGGIEIRNGVPHWKMPAATWWSQWEPLPEGNLILLEMRDGALVRREGTISLAGRKFRLKPPGPGTQYPVLPLHGLLVR